MSFVIRICLVLIWCGVCLASHQEEIGRNILLIEKDDDCNRKLSRSSCSAMISRTKWSYIMRFTPDLENCLTGEPIDLRVPNVDNSVVKCPQQEYWLKGNYEQLSNSYLQILGINFRIGGYLIVPGEGKYPISQGWENGSSEQLQKREEIGQTICELEKIINEFNFRDFNWPQIKQSFILQADQAKAYYIYTYSPDGTKTVCKPGKMMDLHLSTACLVRCPSERIESIAWPLTRKGLKNYIEDSGVPWTLP